MVLVGISSSYTSAMTLCPSSSPLLFISFLFCLFVYASGIKTNVMVLFSHPRCVDLKKTSFIY